MTLRLGTGDAADCCEVRKKVDKQSLDQNRVLPHGRKWVILIRSGRRVKMQPDGAAFEMSNGYKGEKSRCHEVEG